MNWYHVKLVSEDPAGRKFFIEAKSEESIRDRAEELFEDLEIISLDIHNTPVENGVPRGFDDSASTNIAFDQNDNRLKNSSD